MKNLIFIGAVTITVLALVAPEPKIEKAAEFDNNNSNNNIDTSDIRKFTEELDWKTYHNDSIDGMKIISYFARNENDSIESMEMKVERKIETEDQEDISFIMPTSVNANNGMLLYFLNQNIIDGKDSVDFDPEGPVHCSLKEQKDHSSIGYIPTGILKFDNYKEMSLLDKCCKFNHLMIQFQYQDGEEKSILIPLMSFKEKYEELE